MFGCSCIAANVADGGDIAQAAAKLTAVRAAVEKRYVMLLKNFDNLTYFTFKFCIATCLFSIIPQTI